MKDTFSSYHPIVNMLYFALVLGFAMFFTHPVCLGISLACAFVYSIYLKGGKALRFSLLYMLPMFIGAALLNPLLNHEGATILTYLPGGNPLTLESVLYGIAAAVMLVCVIIWFSCFNEVMTSDKFVYLFGRIIPALSLVLSMSLRFVPRFKAQLKIISNAQQCMGGVESNGGLLKRARNGIKILSVMVTWALENAVETADSMKSRGYGLKGRTAFSIYKFNRRDTYALIFLLICGISVITGALNGTFYYRYFPTLKSQTNNCALYIVHCALHLLPLIINLKEDAKWKAIESKT